MIILRPPTTTTPRGKHNARPVLLLVLSLFLSHPAAAQPAPPLHLLIEPAFMRPEVSWPIAGTKAAVLALATIADGDATYLKKSDAERQGLDLPALRRDAQKLASTELAKLTPEFVRDKRGVVLYARLTGNSPATASAVLAPDFAEKFVDTLGPDLLVAIPNRFRVYVYPALASQFQGTSALVRRDYEVSPYPVSREVFRLEKDSLRAVGKFGGP